MKTKELVYRNDIGNIVTTSLMVAEKYGKEVAESTSILYGGSCKPKNAIELFSVR